MHSTNYIVIFVLIMTTIVSITLALLSFGLKPIHDKNEAIYNRRATLSAVADHLDMKLGEMEDDEVSAMFDKNIKQVVVDAKGNILDEAAMLDLGFKSGLAESIEMKKEMKKSPENRALPLYVYNDGGDEDLYILNVRGKGLWDEIWGCIAVKEDLNTIVGVAFDHQAETPGLGAEIKDNKDWKNQFTGKKLYDKDGTYKSITVRKGGARDEMFEVDGISGATITADGVTDMLYSGIQAYEPYLKNLKK